MFSVNLQIFTFFLVNLQYFLCSSHVYEKKKLGWNSVKFRVFFYLQCIRYPHLHFTRRNNPRPIKRFFVRHYWHFRQRHDLSDLFQIYFHIQIWPETDLIIWKSMCFFSVYVIVSQIQSVKNGNWDTSSVNVA